jgi:hypothetical protein
MKLNMHVIITDPAQFLKGNYHNCFSLYDTDLYLPKDWVHCGTVDIDVEPDTGQMIETVSARLDEKILELEGKTEVLRNRKAELLALPSL